MRRRKIRQINLRLIEPLRARLEAVAAERQISTNQLMRQLLEDGLDTKNQQSLASFLADFVRRLRDIVEHSARKEDIELTWRRLRALDAKFAHLYTDVEEALQSYLHDPKVRQLIRGAQQEKGGKL